MKSNLACRVLFVRWWRFNPSGRRRSPLEIMVRVGVRPVHSTESWCLIAPHTPILVEAGIMGGRRIFAGSQPKGQRHVQLVDGRLPHISAGYVCKHTLQ